MHAEKHGACSHKRMADIPATYLIGIDESGRGPIAGPLAVAAVAWQPAYKHTKLFAGVRDSKKLPMHKREFFYNLLAAEKQAGELFYSVSFIMPRVIDRYGMTSALKRGVASALKLLSLPPAETFVMLDGSLFAPKEYAQETIIRGDETVPIISLASVVAKVKRDKRMTMLARRYPEYGFERHKGYGVPAHYAAIRQHGLCEIHRRRFLKELEEDIDKR